MKKSNKRLILRAETVRMLQAAELADAVGGRGPIIIPKTQYTCEILKCIPNTDQSVCDFCVAQ